jgi:hypothetical protein
MVDFFIHVIPNGEPCHALIGPISPPHAWRGRKLPMNKGFYGFRP